MERTPHPPLDADTLEELASAAAAAPSLHNTQPWRHRLDRATATLELRAAPERLLPETDPHGRALHLSAGASLFNLRLAVAHLGWEPVVRLLPHRAEPDLLATVRLAGPRRAPAPPGAPLGADLHDAIARRHSGRFPFSGRRPPDAVLSAVREAAAAEGALAYLPSAQESARVLGLTAEAERRNAGDRARRAESRQWVHRREPYGMPPAVLGPRDARAHMPMRDFTGLTEPPAHPAAPFEPHPLLAVLVTTRDEPAHWLRAGQALEHLLLRATADGVQTSLLHQALEWPDLRWALRDTARGPAHVQMLVRLGYGPAGAATPRRAARDVLDEEDTGPGGGRRRPHPSRGR
jgi:hypothetical protein